MAWNALIACSLAQSDVLIGMTLAARGTIISGVVAPHHGFMFVMIGTPQQMLPCGSMDTLCYNAPNRRARHQMFSSPWHRFLVETETEEGPTKIYVNTNKQVGDPDHLKLFATADAAKEWFKNS